MTVVVKSKKGIRKKVQSIDLNVESNDQKVLSQKCRESLYTNWASLWRKGFPFHYHNEMTDQLGSTYSVEAYPDGSEVLVSMTYDEKRAYYHFEKQLCDKGEGRYYAILKTLIDQTE